MTPKLVLPTHAIAHLYKYDDENSYKYQIRNPAMLDQASDFLSQYNDIALERYEANTILGLPMPGSWWPSYFKATSYWDIAVWTAGVVIIVIASLMIGDSTG